MENKLKRIRVQELHNRVVSADEAASWIQDGMILGLSGFTKSGDAKAVPHALFRRADAGEKFKVDVYTGASLGSDVDKLFAEKGIINKRAPFQAEPAMRKSMNAGEMLYCDQHLSHTAELVRNGVIGPIDYAIVEAVSITEEGLLIPTTSVGNSVVFIKNAKNIIIEINMAQPDTLEGVHDCYLPEPQGQRKPIQITKPSDRIGTIGIPLDLNKVKGIVFTDKLDSPSTIVPPDDETEIMAGHLIEFLRNEIKAGRLTNELAPLQSGIGSIANAVLNGFLKCEFENLEVYSEVLQDAVFDLLDAGKVKFASACSITLSKEKMDHFYANFDRYRNQIILRPQEISNSPELIRRMGLIAVNTALEFDIYGNVNSTHVSGTKMMNGIGGSGDFARNARLGIFVTKSIAKDGKISSIVPMVPHVDHTEHDVDVVVTEQGYADLRGLAPRERAKLIIENCAHPMYRDQLRDYYERAEKLGGQTPHILEEALSWHINLAKEGTMQKKVLQTN